jgi:hypothetical protein
MGGYTLCLEAMRDLVRSMPPSVKEMEIHLPWFALSDGDGIRSLVEAISNHSCQAISLELNGTVPDAANEDVRNIKIVESDILFELLCIDGLEELSLQSLELTLEQCKAIVDLLTTDARPVKFLHISSCAFLNGSGGIVPESITKNTQLKRLDLTDMLSRDDTFRDVILASLPSNESIEELHITYLDQTDCSTTVELIKNIARLNATMKIIRIDVPVDSPNWNREQQDELHQVLQQNYMLEHVKFKNKDRFGIIASLNKAGRRYLRNNASDKHECIQVLSNRLVNNNLDCVYYHLRENPILMITADTSSTSQGCYIKKRIAEEQLEARRVKKALN